MVVFACLVMGILVYKDSVFRVIKIPICLVPVVPLLKQVERSHLRLAIFYTNGTTKIEVTT
jgi:hypothetical protein